MILNHLKENLKENLHGVDEPESANDQYATGQLTTKYLYNILEIIDDTGWQHIK